MADFDVFSPLEIRKRKFRSHGIRKKEKGKRKKRAVKRSNTSLRICLKQVREMRQKLNNAVIALC